MRSLDGRRHHEPVGRNFDAVFTEKMRVRIICWEALLQVDRCAFACSPLESRQRSQIAYGNVARQSHIVSAARRAAHIRRRPKRHPRMALIPVSTKETLRVTF